MSGSGCVLSFFCHDNTWDRSVSRPSRFTIGKRSHSIFLESLVEVTPVCETADTHRPPHVLGMFANDRLVHMICTGLSFCPTSVALLDVSVATLGVL